MRAPVRSFVTFEEQRGITVCDLEETCSVHVDRVDVPFSRRCVEEAERDLLSVRRPGGVEAGAAGRVRERAAASADRELVQPAAVE
jgi:hypothetical protein